MQWYIVKVTIKYVGDTDWQPSDLSGWVLYPLILYCRNLRHSLQEDGRIVYVAKVNSALNRAHTLAYRTLQKYKQSEWTSYDCIAPFEEYLGLQQAVDVVEEYTHLNKHFALTKERVLRESHPA